MKNIFLYILVISFLFFGCKSTDNVATPENIENQDSVKIDEVLPVEDVLENTDLNQNDSTLQNEDNMNLSQSEIDKFIEEKGDLPLPLYDEFVPITEDSSEFDNSDEFYFGDEFIPEDELQISEQIEQENKDLFKDDDNSEQKDFLANELNQVASENSEEVFSSQNDLENFDTIKNDSTQDFLSTTDLPEAKSTTDLKSTSELPENKKAEENLIESVKPLENEKSVIVDDLLNKKNLVSNKNSEKTSIENFIPNNNDENSISSEKDLSQDFSTQNSDVILEDLEKDIVPSRTVYASKNQTIIASYPGNGWVYLGEIESTALVGFKGKTFSSNKTSFKLQPQKEGRTILHFYKLDAINGNYIDDYLEVVISPSTDSSLANTVSAPEFNYDYYLMKNFNQNVADNSEDDVKNEVGQPSINGDSLTNYSNEKNYQEDNSEKVISEKIETPVIKELAEVEVVEEEPELLFMSDIFDEEEVLLADDSENLENSSSDLDFVDTLDLLEQAKKSYEEKDYSKALTLVNKFLETSNTSVDEALYLKGQILEKPFEQRNIRDALECYKIVISTYPQSILWDKCDERIKYIQRFYFNIR